MTDFTPFGTAVANRFKQMSKQELFVTDISGDDLYAAYLAAFPEGTNPMYKTKTEHECSCCKNFIRNLGNVVSIENGMFNTVWSSADKLPYPYDIVSSKLEQLILGADIVSLFRSSEKSYGAAQTKQLLADGTVIKWNHFHGTVEAKHFTKDVGTIVGDYNTKVQVFERGLKELSLAALNEVVDLIDSNSIYRGAEFKGLVIAFRDAVVTYSAASPYDQRLYIWQNAVGALASFRNTVIGTLVQDLSEGKGVRQAVASFEAKVAPTNYKRPTALITPRMIELAMKTIGELGIEDSLARRYATIEDISLTNVIWADNSVKKQMKGGVQDLLMQAVKQAPKNVNPKEISIDDFVSKVLPKAGTLELFVANNMQGNFMSLTAPVYADAPGLFKWDNNFAWSYDGNITDSEIRKAVSSKGGRVDGVFRFSHQWNYGKRNASLMDLHVFMPGCTHSVSKMHNTYGHGRRVGWNNRSDSASGGVQDVDYTQAAPVGHVPVENITFPDIDKMPEGVYECKIHNWALRAPTQGGFKAEIEFAGNVFEYEYDKPLGQKEWVHVASVTLKNKKFTIEHHLPVGSQSQAKWGIATEKFVKVDTIMLSPNHWDGNEVGNKHYFFVLDGCVNTEKTRGIYNEFLKPELDTHRKVFEVLGTKTMCDSTAKQLSGIGLSSTRNDEIVARVDGKEYKIVCC